MYHQGIVTFFLKRRSFDKREKASALVLLGCKCFEVGIIGG